MTTAKELSRAQLTTKIEIKRHDVEYDLFKDSLFSKLLSQRHFLKR